MRRIVLAAAIFGAALLLYGTLGWVHRSSDSIAMLRPVAAALCLLGVLTARSVWPRAGFALLGVWGAGSVLLFAVPRPPGADLRVYSKNVWVRNVAVSALAEDIRQADPDLIFLQELSTRNQSLLSKLSDGWPHQVLCENTDDRVGLFEIAILSRLPIAPGTHCAPGVAAAAQLTAPDGRRFWAVSVHLCWPWPMPTREAEDTLAHLLGTLDGPKVIGGDFNILPWSPRLGRVQRASQTQLAGPMRSTFHLFGLPLPIDHVLSDGGGRITLRPTLGSDHHGLLADLTL